MGLGMSGGEVRGDAEIRPPQILDPRFAEIVAQPPRHLTAPHQRQQRQRIVADRIAVDEGAAQARGQFVVVPAERHAGRHDRAHAGRADHVDRHARLAQRADDADMGKAAGGATRQHEPVGAPREQPAKMSEIGRVAVAHVALHPGREDLEPRPGDRRVGIMRRVQQHEVRRRVPLLPRRIEYGRGRRLAPAGGDEQDTVRLTQAEAAPEAVGGRQIEDEIVCRLDRVEPLGWTLGIGVIDGLDAQPVALERRREVANERHARHVIAQGYDG